MSPGLVPDLESQLQPCAPVSGNERRDSFSAKCLSYDITMDPSKSIHPDTEGFRRSCTTIAIGASEDVVDDNESSTDPLDPEVIKAPDGGYGWVVVFASFMCNFTVDGICYTFGLFLPYFMAEFDSGKAITALAGSLLSGCYMTAGLFVSGLVNHFGCRPVAIVGSIVSAISLGVSTFVPNVYVLIITYGVITGGFFGLIYLPSIVSVGYWFTSKRAMATAIGVCGSGMGAFSFAPFVSWLLEAYHWKSSLRILAGLALTISAYGMLMKPLKGDNSDREKCNSAKKHHADNKNGNIDHKQNQTVGGGKETEQRRRNSIDHAKQKAKECDSSKEQKKEGSSIWDIFDLSVLKIPAMALLSVANIFGMTGYYIPYVYIAGYAEEYIYVEGRKASPNEAAMLLSAIGISNVAGRLIFGFVADKFGGKRIFGSSMKISALLINNCCLMSAALATIAIPFCPSYWVLMVDCILFGFSISSYMSLTSIILVDLLGLDRLASCFGMIIFFRGISSIIGPPLAGLLYELTNSYLSVFATAGLLILISSLTHAMVHRYQK